MGFPEARSIIFENETLNEQHKGKRCIFDGALNEVNEEIAFITTLLDYKKKSGVDYDAYAERKVSHLEDYNKDSLNRFITDFKIPEGHAKEIRAFDFDYKYSTPVNKKLLTERLRNNEEEVFRYIQLN